MHLAFFPISTVSQALSYVSMDLTVVDKTNTVSVLTEHVVI